MIPYGKQDVNEDDIKSLIDVLKSDYLTQGPVVPQFEKEISKYCKSSFAVAVTSATAGLHLSCLALGLKKGDYLWTSPISFVASANCARYCDANVDFVDIDPVTYNIDPFLLEKKLMKAKKYNKLPKIIIPVHLCGHPADMEEIFELSKKYNFKIVEDASHAIGATYKNEPIGNCKYSSLTIFSFHPVKIITTGEGGAITTNDDNLARKIRLLRSHGITRDKEEMISESHGDWYYQQLFLGFNYRLTDIQAALGISQLKRIKSFIDKREEISQIYNKELSLLPITIPQQKNYVKSSRHLYVIRIDNKLSRLNHSNIFHELRKLEIMVNLHYIPIHLQPYYKSLGFHKGDFPNSEKYYEEAISLPIYYQLTEEKLNFVIENIKRLVL